MFQFKVGEGGGGLMSSSSTPTCSLPAGEPPHLMQRPSKHGPHNQRRPILSAFLFSFFPSSCFFFFSFLPFSFFFPPPHLHHVLPSPPLHSIITSPSAPILPARMRPMCAWRAAAVSRSKPTSFFSTSTSTVRDGLALPHRAPCRPWPWSLLPCSHKFQGKCARFYCEHVSHATVRGDPAPQLSPSHNVRLRGHFPHVPDVAATRVGAHDDKGESTIGSDVGRLGPQSSLWKTFVSESVSLGMSRGEAGWRADITLMSLPLVRAKKTVWQAARASEAAAREAEVAIASAAATEEGQQKRQAEEQAKDAVKKAQIANARAGRAAEVANRERDAYHDLHATMAMQYEATPRIVDDTVKELLGPTPTTPRVRADLFQYCLGCAGQHALIACPYVFEDLRDRQTEKGESRFHPTSVTSRLFEARMAYDEEFREVVTYLRKTFPPAPGSDGYARVPIRDTRYAPASAAGLCPIAVSMTSPG